MINFYTNIKGGLYISMKLCHLSLQIPYSIKPQNKHQQLVKKLASLQISLEGVDCYNLLWLIAFTKCFQSVWEDPLYLSPIFQLLACFCFVFALLSKLYTVKSRYSNYNRPCFPFTFQPVVCEAQFLQKKKSIGFSSLNTSWKSPKSLTWQGK